MSLMPTTTPAAKLAAVATPTSAKRTGRNVIKVSEVRRRGARGRLERTTGGAGSLIQNVAKTRGKLKRNAGRRAK